jgi:hypothetical protein
VTLWYSFFNFIKIVSSLGDFKSEIFYSVFENTEFISLKKAKIILYFSKVRQSVCWFGTIACKGFLGLRNGIYKYLLIHQYWTARSEWLLCVLCTTRMDWMHTGEIMSVHPSSCFKVSNHWINFYEIWYEHYASEATPVLYFLIS